MAISMILRKALVQRPKGKIPKKIDESPKKNENRPSPRKMSK